MSDVGKPVLPPYRWVVLAVAMLAGFIGSYAQFQLPPLAYKLMPALHISSSEFAALIGGPLTGSLFICLMGGNLADRFGVKNVVTVGLVLAVIGCTFRYAVTSFWPFFFLTVLAGLASGLLVANLSKLFGAWFPPEQMGTIMGLYMISPMLAMFAGTATTALFPSEASAFIFSGVALPGHPHPLADLRQEQAGGSTRYAESCPQPSISARPPGAARFGWPASACFLSWAP